MADAPVKDRKAITFAFSGGPEWMRLINELTLRAGEFNRSKIMREALTEKADRELPSNWRQLIGIEDGEAA